MGWFSSSKPDPSSTSTSTSATADPLRNLDPELRAFLEQESPIKYKPTSAPPPPPEPSPPKPPPSTPPTSINPTSSSPVPSQSLYPDGRYAHLWTTYRPLAEVENETKTDQEKLLDVLDGYKQRKADIGRAALENCALEQQAITDCFKSGGVKARMTMCRQENREFERCYTLQSVCHHLEILGSGIARRDTDGQDRDS
jgi:hypothetical protein